MLQGVPVVTMDFCDEIHDVDFIDARATRHVTDFDQLTAAVRELIAHEVPPAELVAMMRRYLTNTFHALDGRASERGAKALFDLAGLCWPMSAEATVRPSAS